MERAEQQLAIRFREFAAACRQDGLPMYARLSDHAAGDPTVLGLAALALPGQARPVLLLAAVQRVLFDHPDHPLARFYPSISGRPAPKGDPVPAFTAFVHEHAAALAELTRSRSTQTNEVNRSVAVAAALRAAVSGCSDRPLALVELGPSAGLNLLADTYAIRIGTETHQQVDSPVRLATALVGEGRPDFDSALPPVVARVGLDLAPVDVRADHEAVRWLEACLWPEQRDRFERFRAAVRAAQASPPRLVQGDLLDDLPALLDSLPAGAHAMVFHTWVLTYVARDRRPQLAAILRGAAASRPVSWLSAEAPGVVAGLPKVGDAWGGTTVLALTRFRAEGTRTELLGTCHPHLTWLRWDPEPPA